jgi:hypothetical protein
MASMKSRSRPSHKTKLHMLAGPLCAIPRRTMSTILAQHFLKHTTNLVNLFYEGT